MKSRCQTTEIRKLHYSIKVIRHCGRREAAIRNPETKKFDVAGFPVRDVVAPRNDGGEALRRALDPNLVIVERRAAKKRDSHP